MPKRQRNGRERLNIVIAGHVDHGKSTIIGRLFADTHSLDKGKLDRIKRFCERNSKPFEYAFLIDALKDEQNQGITIDSARVFFKTKNRDYLIIDAPGHIEFLKNMVSGASHASAALLVIDAKEGVGENSRRHGTMLGMLGIRQVTVLVNKMDLVGYKKRVYEKIVGEYESFLKKIGMPVRSFIPVSGLYGKNIASPSKDVMPWHKGKTVIDALDAFLPEPTLSGKLFRMPVQDVYKFTKMGDGRRIIVGTVASGRAKKGDEVAFFPSGKTAVIDTVESFPKSSVNEVTAGQAVGFTLTEQIFVKRGELAALARQARPQVSKRIQASVFWLGKDPLKPGKEYHIKLGTAKLKVRLEKVTRVMDASTLAMKKNVSRVERHEVADCVLAAQAPLAFDPADSNVLTGRFVIIDGCEIAGGGLVRKALGDSVSEVYEKAAVRKVKWQRSFVTPKEREKRYGQHAAMIVVTGAQDELRKKAAKGLEKELFKKGKHVYFLGIGSVLYGLDADIRGEKKDHGEDIRRLAEVAHILLDAGMILIVTAAELTQEDMDLIKAAVSPGRIVTFWVGSDVSTNIRADAILSLEPEKDIVPKAVRFLESEEILDL